MKPHSNPDIFLIILRATHTTMEQARAREPGAKIALQFLCWVYHTYRGLSLREISHLTGYKRNAVVHAIERVRNKIQTKDKLTKELIYKLQSYDRHQT
jgi:hypothetical protein